MKALFLSFAVGLFVGVLFGVIRGKLCARALEVVAGLSLAFGIYPRLAAVALVVFLVPSTVIGHAFWRVDCLLYHTAHQLSQEHSHRGWLAVYQSDAIPTDTASAYFPITRSGTDRKRAGFSQSRGGGLIPDVMLNRNAEFEKRTKNGLGKSWSENRSFG
jgi:xanthosine utilization system XapX-like protein